MSTYIDIKILNDMSNARLDYYRYFIKKELGDGYKISITRNFETNGVNIMIGSNDIYLYKTISCLEIQESVYDPYYNNINRMINEIKDSILLSNNKLEYYIEMFKYASNSKWK